jgi:hypothetical protein
MKFYEVVEQVRVLLQQCRRIGTVWLGFWGLTFASDRRDARG